MHGQRPSKEELLRRITEAAAPAAASFGLELWGIELIGSGRPVARVFVDAPASAATLPAEENGDRLPPGVTVDQCAEISRMVGLALDVEELFSDAWTLEVSSPGLERPFFRPEQLPPYMGREVDALLWDPHPIFRPPQISRRTDGRGGRRVYSRLSATDASAVAPRGGACAHPLG